jgi:hypothetical protein
MDRSTGGPDLSTTMGRSLGQACRSPNGAQCLCTPGEFRDAVPVMLTSAGSGTWVRGDVDLLRYNRLELGCILLHELVHTRHTRTIHNGPCEGEAYGVEYFFATRCCLLNRPDVIRNVVGRNYSDGIDAFALSYGTLKILYAAIDGRPHAQFSSITADHARDLATEYVTEFDGDRPRRLNDVISHVRQNLARYRTEVGLSVNGASQGALHQPQTQNARLIPA